MFDLKMPLTDALAVSLIGIVTVILILAVIACLILLVSKAIRSIEAAAAKKKPAAAEAAAPAPSGVPMPAGMNQGELELVGTDEKTAAIIMAIVSDKSGIPLNRLSFKSIKLMEDK
ncbi:MAG: OadG family transporter subunit [Acutalibacteraceae bacterium]|nr:OadG family transporter subunit [Acutalibacteraceae bacterium]